MNLNAVQGPQLQHGKPSGAWVRVRRNASNSTELSWLHMAKLWEGQSRGPSTRRGCSLREREGRGQRSSVEREAEEVRESFAVL